MAAKIIRWLIFGVVGSLAPLILNYFISIGRLSSFNLAPVVKQGELLIVTAAMCSVSMGELIGSGVKGAMTTIAGGTTFVVLVLATGLFSYIPAGHDLAESFIASVSYGLFSVSFVSSISCIALAAAEE